MKTIRPQFPYLPTMSFEKNTKDVLMANPDQILAILEDLLYAYPNQKLPRQTLQIYIDHLSDIHPYLLEKCVNNLIENSTWFPRASEICTEARRIAGPHTFSTWEPPPNPLRVRFREPEDGGVGITPY